MVRDNERPDLHDRPFCAYCIRRITTEADHADDCLRHFEAEMPLPDPDDVRFGVAGSVTPTGDNDE